MERTIKIISGTIEVTGTLSDCPTATAIWKALFEFQKDGVKAAINKILTHNGCIIADSAGLGKTLLLSYGLMALLEIGLKVSTLPVAALGVGVGVAYGIYLYSRFRTFYQDGHSVREGYFRTLEVTGNGVLFTGVTLAIGVATWMLSPLKFQADMGLLLAFLFLMNMIGALVLLPALAHFLFDSSKRHQA